MAPEPRKRRILFVIHLPPPFHGAAEAGRLLKESALIRDQFDAEFISLSASSDLTEIGQFSWSKVARLIALSFRVAGRLICRRYDAVYFSPSPSVKGFSKEWPLYLLARWRTNSRLFHFHAKGLAECQACAWSRSFLRTGLAGGHAIVLSDRLKSDIVSWFPDNRIHIQSYGIVDFRSERQRQDSVPRFLFLGNLIVTKGIRVLLEAAEMLRKNNIPFELVIVGAGSDVTVDSFAREVTDRGLADVVRVAGPLYGAEKEQMLADSDVLVFPTFYPKETFGLVNLEAMKYGLPVISTDAGGIPDVIVDGETGYLVPQQNAQALAMKMELLAGNELLRLKMGQAARNRFINMFTIDHYTHGIVRILKQVLETR